MSIKIRQSQECVKKKKTRNKGCHLADDVRHTDAYVTGRNNNDEHTVLGYVLRTYLLYRVRIPVYSIYCDGE